jgi:hypothetical protein
MHNSYLNIYRYFTNYTYTYVCGGTYIIDTYVCKTVGAYSVKYIFIYMCVYMYLTHYLLMFQKHIVTHYHCTTYTIQMHRQRLLHLR